MQSCAKLLQFNLSLSQRVRTGITLHRITPERKESKQHFSEVSSCYSVGLTPKKKIFEFQVKSPFSTSSQLSTKRSTWSFRRRGEEEKRVGFLLLQDRRKCGTHYSAINKLLSKKKDPVPRMVGGITSCPLHKSFLEMTLHVYFACNENYFRLSHNILTTWLLRASGSLEAGFSQFDNKPLHPSADDITCWWLSLNAWTCSTEKYFSLHQVIQKCSLCFCAMTHSHMPVTTKLLPTGRNKKVPSNGMFPFLLYYFILLHCTPVYLVLAGIKIMQWPYYALPITGLAFPKLATSSCLHPLTRQ